MELTLEQQDTLVDNMTIFEDNGFQFSVGDRITLQAVPTCDNKVFTKDDIEEMLHVIKETQVSLMRDYHTRPIRIYHMFSSDSLKTHKLK